MFSPKVKYYYICYVYIYHIDSVIILNAELTARIFNVQKSWHQQLRSLTVAYLYGVMNYMTLLGFNIMINSMSSFYLENWVNSEHTSAGALSPMQLHTIDKSFSSR